MPPPNSAGSGGPHAVAVASARQGDPMPELPELTPENFEILVVRELRKVGLDVGELRVHRRATLPEPQLGYLLEIKGVVSRPPWQRRGVIAPPRAQTPLRGPGGRSRRGPPKGARVCLGPPFGTPGVASRGP